ncbi:flagellar filament capping protein FliD [Kineothrix sp. MB12-C1]|uniref:flagellar filament capping protein FliD n=1 Tax=Kineothrix sp. MB12-C1 TaxID=3070215 RepID=UPI0027D2B719|nr:flagellar filament capping protein FliD [Kineothrix sp. MB12-C1]WMC93888.1 flagellar filament capping protein FliD [Kineothrix sp. MB12-C1]
MPIRITGMNSGLDTESIISELMKAKRISVDNVKKQQTKLQWKQDAWKDLNSKVYKLFNTTLNNMRFSTDYSKKITSVSDSSVASVVSSDNAMNAAQELKIIRKASAGFLTGAKLNGGSYTKSSKLVDITDADGDKIEAGSSFSVTVGGKTTDITVTENMTMGSLVSALKSAGVDANFDEKNQRLFIGATTSGTNGDFSITASNKKGITALSALGIFDNGIRDDGEDTAVMKEYKKYADMTQEDKEATINAEVAKRLVSYIKQQKSLNETKEKQETKLQELKTDYTRDGYTGNLDDADTKSKLQADIDDLKSEIENLGTPEEGTPEATALAEKNEALAELRKEMAYVTSYEKAKASLAATEASLAEVESYLDEDGISASDTLIDEVTDMVNDKIESAIEVLANASTNADMKRIDGQDATITLNGVEYTSTSNVFEVNGLTITVLGQEGDEATLTTRQDTDGIYNMITNFIKEYNSLINEMDKLYNADRAKGYEPLTEEEKKEMSESEVEKWESKVKDAILKGDSNLSTVASSLKSIMLAGTEVNGKRMNLSDFGIETLGYFSSANNEKSAYHIDGDENDSNTSTKENKLKAAIASDSDTVIAFFSQLSQSLYSNLNKMTAGTDLRSFGSIYDDKKMKEDYDSYTTRIKTLEQKLNAMEDRYYKQFSAMETALAKLQSNQSAVSSLLGGL